MTTIEQSFASTIARLELQNRLLVVLLIVFAAIGLTAMMHNDKVVRAHAFELVTADGALRAALRFEEGNPVFTLNDTAGVERLKLFYEPDATGIYVLDEESTPRIGIAQFSHGGGGVALHGPQSKGAAVLYLKGEGSLRFFDVDGKVSMQVPAHPNMATDQPSDQK